MSSIRVTRRQLLAVSMAALVAPSAAWAAGKLSATPFQTVGPFYPMLRPLDQDGDLTVVAGNNIVAKGEIIEVTGRVLDGNGIPVKGARIELWQANSAGRYNHPSEPDTGRAADAGFQGFGVQLSDTEGRYRFKTVKPGAYPAGIGGRMRTPHIHFDVQGRKDRLITQMYFPGEALNSTDFILAEVDDKPAVIARRPDGSAATMLWDIVLSSG